MTDDELIEWLLDWGRIGEEPVLIEAASRIKKLGAALNRVVDLTNCWHESVKHYEERIEKLEAALRYIERHAGNPNIWYAKIVRKALDAK